MVVILLVVVRSADEGLTITSAIAIGCSGFVVIHALREARRHGDFRSLFR